MIACSVVMVPGEVIKGLTNIVKQDGVMGLYAG